jgi:TonB family protein
MSGNPIKANFDLPIEPNRPISIDPTPVRTNFGLLPEPGKGPASFITSGIINSIVLVLVIYIGMTAKPVIQLHRYEQTELILPITPPPAPIKMKLLPLPKVALPKLHEVKLEQPKINMPKIEPNPEPKPIQLEAKQEVPVIKGAKPSIIIAPQPKAALTAAAPAQVPQAHASPAPVHFGETFGATPNPNGSRPPTVAAIGNPYGGMQGPAVALRGVVGSAGIGNGTKAGSNAGVVAKVASVGIPGGTGTSGTYTGGKVASAGIPQMQSASVPAPSAPQSIRSTNLEVLSKPSVQYTSEARALRVQGNVILRVTFTAAGQVLVQGVVKGLGHGLDEEARRVAEQIHFHPATRNGEAVDTTTNITINFQLA